MSQLSIKTGLDKRQENVNLSPAIINAECQFKNTTAVTWKTEHVCLKTNDQPGGYMYQKKPLEKDVCFLVDTLFIPKGANFLKKSNNYEMKYTTTAKKLEKVNKRNAHAAAASYNSCRKSS